MIREQLNPKHELPKTKRTETLKSKLMTNREIMRRLMDSFQEVYEKTQKELNIPYVTDNKSQANEKKALILNIFDSHFGKVIQKGQKQVYNMNIAAKRLATIFDEAMLHIQNNKQESYDEIYIVLGGDHVEGDGSTYPSQVREMEDGILTQVMRFNESILTNIHRISEFMGKKGKVSIICAPGNHGISKANKSMHPVLDNYDTGIYMSIWSYVNMTKASAKMLENVDVYFPMNVDYINFNIKNWKVQVRHKLPKNFGTPSVQNKVYGWTQGHDIDMLLTGHFHDAAMANIGKTKVVRVGCLPGGDDFAESLGLFGNAEQTMIVTSSNKLIDKYIPITF